MPSKSSKGSLFQINVNPKGGVPKYAVPETYIYRDRVEGDKQAHRRFHGGPERAVTLYALERIQGLQQEGHPIAPGSVGENLTIVGLDWDLVQPGTRLQVGEDVELEISSYARPCDQISESFSNGKTARISHHQHNGWSRVCARVIQEGKVVAGDHVVLFYSQEQND